MAVSRHMANNAKQTVLIHKVISRGLDQIISISDTLKPEQQAPFFTYCEIWGEFLHQHHDHEEELVFPCFKAIGGEKFIQLDEELRKQHDTLIPDLTSFIELAKSRPSSDAIQKLKELGEKIRLPLLPHLLREEETLCSLEYCKDLPDEPIGAMIAKLKAEVRKASPTRNFPLIVFHLDQEERDAFGAELPGFLKSFLFPLLAWYYYPVWDLTPKVTRVGGTGRLTYYK